MGQKINPNVFRVGINKKWQTQFFEKSTQELKDYTFKDLEIQNFVKRFLNIYNLTLYMFKINYTEKNLNIYISYYITINFKYYSKNKIFFKIIDNDNKNCFIYLNNKQKMKKTIILSKKAGFIKRFNFNSCIDYEHKKLLKIESKLKKLLENLKKFKNNNVKVTFECINNKIQLNVIQKKIFKKNLFLLRQFKRTEFFKDGINIIFWSIYLNRNSSELLLSFIEKQLKTLKRHNFLVKFLKKSLKLFLKSDFSLIKGIQIKLKGRLNGFSRAKQKIIKIGDIPIHSIKADIGYGEKSITTSNGNIGVKIWTMSK
jgi:hypothetical protein